MVLKLTQTRKKTKKKKTKQKIGKNRCEMFLYNLILSDASGNLLCGWNCFGWVGILFVILRLAG